MVVAFMFVIRRYAYELSKVLECRTSRDLHKGVRPCFLSCRIADSSVT